MKKKFLAVILIVCGLLSDTVLAQIEVRQYTEADRCVVTGEFDKPNMTVNLQILRPGVTDEMLAAADPSQADEIGGLILAVLQLRTDEDGKINDEFKMNDLTGTYRYRYRTTDSATVNEGSFYYVNQAMLSELTEAVNAADTAEKVCELLEEKGETCGIDMTYYAALSSGGRESVAAALLKKSFGSFAELNRKFKIAAAEQNLTEQKDADVIIGMLKAYGEEMEIEKMSGYELYADMNDKQKKDFAVRLASDDAVVSLETLSVHFCEHAVLAAWYGAEAWTDGEGLLKAYPDVLGVDLGEYNNLKSRSAVLKMLSGKRFDSASDFCRYFNQAVSEQAQKEKSSGSSGGSGGGSSHGGYIDSALPQEEASGGDTEALFDDLEAVPWAAEYIETLAKQGIIGGREERKFYPQDYITREEYLKLLVECFGLKDDTAVCEFDDVKRGEWYYSYVASGVRNGITEGVSEYSFGTGQPISRQDLAVMTVRALENRKIVLPAVDEEKMFKDGIADYAYDSVRTLQTAGIINGIGEAEFAPERSATRAEAAKIIYCVMSAAGAAEL